MNINYITLAQNLQRLMDEKGVDRKTLCKDLGLKYVTVSSWLGATKYPRIDKIEMLANYFNVPKAYLTERGYTQIEGGPHLFDSKKSAPAEDDRSKKIKEVMEKIGQLSDSDLVQIDDFISFIASKSKSDAEE